MEPKINIITLGVKDIARSKAFYEEMGFIASSASNEHFVAFKANGVVLCLFPDKMLAEDATVELSQPGFKGVTVAYCVANKEEVKEILAQAESAGGNIVKPAQDVFWGGHSGYFSDPDGHLWEIAWNPHWPVQVDGTIQIPD